ncbi:MAG: TlpA disulfide reductase family protein [Bryobacteraceae bacterium]
MRLFAFLIVAAGLCFGANELSNRRAPSFTLPDSNLKDYDLLDFRGKWVLIDFMKTDCPHCVALSKNLEPLKAKYGAKVQVLSVVIAPPENQDSVKRYAMQNKVTSPIVFDQGQMTRTYFRLTPQKPSYDTPHLFVIDPAGRIVRDWGYDDKNKALLEGPGLGKELDGLILGGKK